MWHWDNNGLYLRPPRYYDYDGRSQLGQRKRWSCRACRRLASTVRWVLQWPVCPRCARRWQEAGGGDLHAWFAFCDSAYKARVRRERHRRGRLPGRAERGRA